MRQKTFLKRLASRWTLCTFWSRFPVSFLYCLYSYLYWIWGAIVPNSPSVVKVRWGRGASRFSLPGAGWVRSLSIAAVSAPRKFFRSPSFLASSVLDAGGSL